MQLYKEDKVFDARSDDDDTEEDDSGYESENIGEPWTNYKDEKYITDKELEIVFQKIIK